MGEERKVQSRKRYFTAFIIGTFLFILGFLISISVSNAEFNRLNSLQGTSSYSIFEDKLDYSFFNSNICSNDSYIKISRDLGFQGSLIGDLEDKLGKNNEKVISQKRFYSLVEIEHFEFVNNINQKCNYNISTILFFYSNDPNEVKDSEYIGGLLDYVVERNNNLVVYSFDINLDSDVMKKLMSKYNITEPFTVIINNQVKVDSPSKIEDIEQYLV